MRKGHLKEMVVRLGRGADLSRILLLLGTVVLLCFSAARLGAQDFGTLLPEDLAVSTVAGVEASGKMDVAFDGTKYLIVWPQYYYKEYSVMVFI